MNILLFTFLKNQINALPFFSLLNYYESIIEENLSVNKLPKVLKLLPAVCSAFNPHSTNGLGGEGFWHLNYPQAIKYGLTVNKYVDERRDFSKSTIAATKYIKDLFTMYNSWELTLTAYSCGVTTVNKLLIRHSANTYKEIYPFLQGETKNLVQAFVAMNYIYNYDSYGAVKITPLIEADTIQIDRQLKMEAINHVIATDSKSFKFLNPTLNKDIFPHNYCAYFPKGTKEKFIALEDSIYFYQDSVMLKPKSSTPQFIIPKDGEPFIYTTKSGDILGVIAQRFNVRVSQLQDWNNINGTRIDIGQKITIYGKTKNKSKTKEPKVKKSKGNKKNISTPILSKGLRTTYIVKSGDNLWAIAKKFSGVSGQNIMDYNNIDGNLKIGQVLKIPKK